MKKAILSLSALAAIGALTHSLPAFAGENGLYPAAPPPGSAFIRFLNASSPSPVAVKVHGKAYGAAAFSNISSYASVPHGETDVSLGNEKTSSDLKEGAYYTAALVKGHLTVLEEPSADNKLKAQVILINASNTPDVALKTADGSASIVDKVDPVKVGGRAVNAVNAPFAVYTADKKIDDLGAHLLERGNRYSVIVYDGPNGKPAATFN